MANPSISVKDEVLEKFDAVRMAKAESMAGGVRMPRSAVIESLMKEWIEENEHYLEEGNVSREIGAAD